MKVFRAVNEKQVKPLSPAHHALIHIESFSEAAQRTQACATLSIGSFYCSSWFRFNLPICRGITLSFTNVFFVTKEGPKKKISWHTRVNFGPPAQNTPPPKPPFLTSHTNKKGVNLLRIQAAICLPSIAIPDKLQGKNWFATLSHWPPVQCTNPAKTFAKALFYNHATYA